MSQTNFLIGRGELLTHEVKGPKRKPGKKEVYTLQEATKYLVPQFNKTSTALDGLPSHACPGDFGVARLMINPSYIARSFFPVAMLKSVGLESVGSRTVKVTPKGWNKKGTPRECTTTELFVAGKRSAFRDMKTWVTHVEPESKEALDLAHIENFSPFTFKERIVRFGNKQNKVFEVGIHLLPDENQSFIKQSFIKYAKEIEVKVYNDPNFTAGNLWFIAVEGNHDQIKKLAQFVFVRVIRPMPKLRGIRPAHRSSGLSVSCNLPTEQPLSSEPRVAILDGIFQKILQNYFSQ